MSFLNGKEWGSKGNQVLDFFPRIVDVGAEMTFANTQENRKKLPPFLGQIRHLQLKIFPIFCFRIYVKVLGKLPQSSQKKSTQHSLACKKQNFAVLLQRQFLASQKSLLLQRPTKSGGTIKNETTWYQIRCGMGFTCLVVTCSACSRLQHNERMEK